MSTVGPTGTSEPSPDPSSGRSSPARQCPNCGSFPQLAAVCGECGFPFDGSDNVPVWDEQVWEVVVRPDRQYYEMIEPDGMEFPEAPYHRRIALIGDHARIGRRSHTKKITPEIDLSGTLEDTGVSHRHAVVMRQPNGSWALVDQDSTNGTYLNGDEDPVPANHPIPLNDGDQIHVGAWTTLTVERAEAGWSQSVEVDTPSKDTRNVARGRQAFEIRLLGPMQVTVGGEVAVIGAAKARAVLAYLALRIGSVVSASDLEWALWGDEGPRTAGKALQGYISALRRIVSAEGIETSPQGYRLTGPKDAVDVFRFERRSARGQALLSSGHPGAAVAEIQRALDLWQGDPLPDLADGLSGASEITQLSERRAGAEEDLFEGRLQLGDHRGVIAELTAAVDAEPLRERRWGQLMLALHRSGRQVEALRTFQRLRANLSEEHGVEPSAELAELERAIVLDRPELRWTPPGSAGTAAAV